MTVYHPNGARTVAVQFGAPVTNQLWRNTSGKRLFLNADKTEVVEEGHEDASFLLAGPGGTITMLEAAQYGLIDDAPETFMPPAVADSLSEMEEHNLKAKSQKLRHQAFVSGGVVDAEEGLAMAKDVMENKEAPPKIANTATADASVLRPEDDDSEADDKEKSTAAPNRAADSSTRDKSVSGPDKNK